MTSRRRVSFDPLALLWDASLEGELDLVQKIATQVPNPSAANDEGITALHNATSRGHSDMAKFLVELGCDVNAQNKDGWTPLHFAASRNNLAIAKLMIESGACPFALTHFSHETPADKCERDEAGFEACSKYLSGIQEKLGTMNKCEVYATVPYKGKKPDELSLEVNDQLVVVRKGADTDQRWFAKMKKTGKEGYVPRVTLALHPRILQKPFTD